MSRVTFIAAGAIADDLTGAASFTPTPPPHIANDILIAAGWNTGGSKPTTATGGWTEIATIAGTEDATWWWARAAAAGTAGPTITAADTDCFGIVYVFRGCLTSDTPYEDATTSGDGTTTDTTPDSALITTVGPDRLAVCFLSHGDDIDFASGSPPSTWTLESNVMTGDGTDAGFNVISKYVAAAGNVASVVIGTWAAGEAYGALTLAFIPEITMDSWGELIERPTYRKKSFAIQQNPLFKEVLPPPVFEWVHRGIEQPYFGKMLISPMGSKNVAKFGIAAAENGFYRSITLDQPASDLTDFPVLFSGTYTYLKTIANGGKVNNANGYDITFYSDAALTTLLKFERVFWDATTGVVEFWVKVPTLASASATVIYLAYGNIAISTDQQDKLNTWNTNFKGVWHLQETSGNLLASAGVTNMVPNGSPTQGSTGQIKNAVAFASASSQYLTSTASGNFSAANFTISAWIKKASTGVAHSIFSKSGVTSDIRGYIFQVRSTNKLQLDFQDFGQATANTAISDTTTWHYVVVAYDGANANFYLDGAADGTPALSAFGTITQSQRIGVTNIFSLQDYFDGTIDEVRYSNSVRTTDWIAAEYSNQNDPANFYIIGSETPV